MSAVRSFPSISAVALAALLAAGCYDLSDPSGPHRDDFVREKNPTQTQEQGQTSTETRCDPSTCKGAEKPIAAPGVYDLEPDDTDDRPDAARVGLRIVPDDAP